MWNNLVTKISSLILPILLFVDKPETVLANNEPGQAPNEPAEGAKNPEHEGSPVPPATPPPAEEDTQELIVIDENTVDLDLNHGRIGKIENLEPLNNLQR